MDAKLIKKVKDYKAAIADLCTAPWAIASDRFLDKANAFIASVPRLKKDFENLDFNNFVREYSAIRLIANSLESEFEQNQNATYVEFENSVKHMYADVFRWSKESTQIDDFFKKEFLPVYNSFLSAYDRSDDEFPSSHAKFFRLQSLKDELEGFYFNFFELIEAERKVRSLLNEEIENKQEEVASEVIMNKATEIKEGQVTLSIRGGKRPGAGRKAIGIKKAVSISLPSETWSDIEALISSGQYDSNADFFRSAAFVLLSGVKE